MKRAFFYWCAYTSGSLRTSIFVGWPIWAIAIGAPIGWLFELSVDTAMGIGGICSVVVNILQYFIADHMGSEGL